MTLQPAAFVVVGVHLVAGLEVMVGLQRRAWPEIVNAHEFYPGIGALLAVSILHHDMTMVPVDDLADGPDADAFVTFGKDFNLSARFLEGLSGFGCHRFRA